MVVKNIEHLPNQEVKLQIEIPANEIEETRKKVVSDLASEVKIEGFRKGKAPKELVEEKLDKSKIKAEIINRLIPRYYTEAVQKQKIQPIISPEIEVKQFEEESELIFEATTALKPEVDLGNYKEAVKEALQEKGKKGKTIYGPEGEPLDHENTKTKGQENKRTEEHRHEHQHPQNEIAQKQTKAVKALLDEAEVKMSELIIERETNRMLSKFLGQLEQMNMPVEQYLEARGTTAEKMRKKYRDLAKDDLKLEFILDKIGEEEKIEVSDDEIKEAIKHAPEEEVKKTMESEEGKAYIRHVLKNRKVIENITKF